MKYRSIFIANIAEIAKTLIAGMMKDKRDEEVFEDHAYCDRFLSSDTDKRVLITPLPFDNEFSHDMFQLLNYRHTKLLSPDIIDDSICHAILKDTHLLKEIEDIITVNPEITIHSYAVTEEFKELIACLRKKGLIFKTHEMPDPDASWTAPFFDSKAGFRQCTSLFSDHLPDMPKGIIVSSKEELIGWMIFYMNKFSGVVLKSNRGLAGAGLRILPKGALSVSGIPDYVETMIKEEPFWLKQPVVVEEYIEPEISVCGGSPNVELCVINGSTQVLYTCSMRVNSSGVFMGIEFGKNAVPKRLKKQLIKTGRAFGNILSSVHYEGHFEIDFVFGKKLHRLYPIEANVRRTGGTHAYELAKRLLGEKFEKEYYLISTNKIDAPILKGTKYHEVKRLLKSVLFPIKDKKEGVVITMTNYLSKGKLGCVIIGKSCERAQKIEQKLISLIV